MPKPLPQHLSERSPTRISSVVSQKFLIKIPQRFFLPHQGGAGRLGFWPWRPVLTPIRGKSARPSSYFWDTTLTWISHYRANATAPQFSTALRNVGAGAGMVRCATLQGADPASPAHPLETRTSTRPRFARYEFCEISRLIPNTPPETNNIPGSRELVPF